MVIIQYWTGDYGALPLEGKCNLWLLTQNKK